MIVIDSDERRAYEQAGRQQAMERARQKLKELQERIAAGGLSQPEKIGAAVKRRYAEISSLSIFSNESLRAGPVFYKSPTPSRAKSVSRAHM